MGLSKKLGQVASQRALSPELPVEVVYKWSTQSYVIQDIMAKFKLPCVVQCDSDGCNVQWSRFQFDLRHPLLLYSKQTVRKIHARNLNADTGEEVGPPVAIPEDFDGWFGASTKGSSQTKRHTRIEGIANSNTARFLVCTKCPALTTSVRSQGGGGGGDAVEYLLRDVHPGETFKRVGVIDGNLEDPKTPEIVRLNGPCMECLDEKDDSVFIPLSRRAIAYEIGDTYPDANHKVFKAKSMVSAGNSKLPRIVSLVHGERPLLDFAYTGVLRCYSVYTEETIIAATLDDPTALCLEMTTDSNAKFRLSLNERTIKRTCEYHNALELCKASGDTFMLGIKASFTMKPTPPPEDLEVDTSLFDVESTSDMHDVDANSEFDIEWSSDHNTDSYNSHYKDNLDNFELNTKTRTTNPKEKNTKLRGDSGRKDEGGQSDDTAADFTEQEIADLMVQKGMMQRLGAHSSSDLNLSEEIETLRRERKKANSHHNPPAKVTAFLKNEERPVEDTQVVLESENGDFTTVTDTSDIVDISLDESDFNSAVCKKASEYHDIESGTDSDDDKEVEIDAISLHSDTLPASNRVDFSHGLNVPAKAASCDMTKAGKGGDQQSTYDKDESPMLQRFKSESNISKIMDRFKENESDKKSISSKRKFCKSSKSSLPEKDKDNNLFTFEDDHDQFAIDC